ncbi:MAG TPA: YgjP-like metallopeptidase domain-containing protein, partial [Burkholderiaceae bacterium]|nr:YgjP-like metallopeptidase domain-containing protein [Burkholderiaceae bacterium]
QGFRPARIPELIEQKQNWIRRALERAEVRRRALGADTPWCLPQEIELPALGRTWLLTATPSALPWVAIRAAGTERLIVSGNIHDERACRRALLKWLARQAHEHLAPQLQALGEQFDLRYRRVYLRRQRTRWGSCSRHKTIALNIKLLFLPPPLVRYVLVHELCHLAHMNHSARFWSLVEQLHPGARADDRALRDGWKSVSRWAG